MKKPRKPGVVLVPEADRPPSPSALLERLIPHRILQGAGAQPVDPRALLEAISDYQVELEAQNEALHAIQTELGESRDRYFELYELAPTSHITFDERGRIVEGNQHLEALLARQRSTYLGRPLVAFLATASANALQLTLRREHPRERFDLDLTILRPDESVRHVRLDAIGRKDGAGRQQWRAVVTDVTELKDAESHIRMLNIELAARIDELTRANRRLASENQERQGLARQLERRQLELRQLSRQVITSQDEERRRLARELHDETGQSLGALVAELRALEDSDEHPVISTLAKRMRDQVSSALRDVRRLAQTLHPAALVSAGLVAAFERLVCDLKALHRVDIECQLGGFSAPTRLPPSTELTLFRVAQEALANALKHAHARHISLVLVTHGRRVRLIVEDDGEGFDVHEAIDSSLGLVGMRERVGLVGGDMQVESAPGRGTTVVVSLPLEDAAPRALEAAHP